MLDNILKLMSLYSYKEFSYKWVTLINIKDWYEIKSLNSYQFFKDTFLELYDINMIYIVLNDFITYNKKLKQIINSHKRWIFTLWNWTFNIHNSKYDTRWLFDDQKFYDFYNNEWADLELDLYINVSWYFIDQLFDFIKEELWIWDNSKDIIWNNLFDEIDKTLLSKISYSWKIELIYKFNDIINTDKKYIYFLLKKLQDSNNLKLENIKIKEWKIKFIISDLVDIKRRLFTSIWLEKLDDNLEIIYLKTDKGCDLVKWDLIASFIKTEKPFKIVERIFKNKTTKKKSINLASLHKLLYWESYERSLHEDRLLVIKNIIKGINKKVKPLNNWKSVLSFRGLVLKEL